MAYSPDLAIVLAYDMSHMTKFWKISDLEGLAKWILCNLYFTAVGLVHKKLTDVVKIDKNVCSNFQVVRASPRV